MKHRHAPHHRVNEEQKALIFCLTMVGIVAFSALMAFSSSGPIILGTEMNTNGLVEYLCLGADCNKIF